MHWKSIAQNTSGLAKLPPKIKIKTTKNNKIEHVVKPRLSCEGVI
jgi:hypothetical protein